MGRCTGVCASFKFGESPPPPTHTQPQARFAPSHVRAFHCTGHNNFALKLIPLAHIQLEGQDNLKVTVQPAREPEKLSAAAMSSHTSAPRVFATRNVQPEALLLWRRLKPHWQAATFQLGLGISESESLAKPESSETATVGAGTCSFNLKVTDPVPVGSDSQSDLEPATVTLAVSVPLSSSSSFRQVHSHFLVPASF
jgi:hypothetical protein